MATQGSMSSSVERTKLNIGCGSDVRAGYVNVDSVALEGVDVVHDVASFPWPFEDDSVDEVILIHVMEHLPDLIKTVEELHRITRVGGEVVVRVPYYNSPDMFADPTHCRFFSERSFDFFDPERPECQERPYYSVARFDVELSTVWGRLFGYYLPFSNRFLKAMMIGLGRRLGSVVWVIEFRLRKLEFDGPRAD